MATRLLDTTVAVDLQRNYLPARQWLQLQQQDELLLPRPVWFGLIRSSGNREELTRTLRLIKSLRDNRANSPRSHLGGRTISQVSFKPPNQ